MYIQKMVWSGPEDWTQMNWKFYAFLFAKSEEPHIDSEKEILLFVFAQTNPYACFYTQLQGRYLQNIFPSKIIGDFHPLL